MASAATGAGRPLAVVMCVYVRCVCMTACVLDHSLLGKGLWELWEGLWEGPTVGNLGLCTRCVHYAGRRVERVGAQQAQGAP